MRLGAATLTLDKVCPTVADLTAKLFRVNCMILSLFSYLFHAIVLYTKSFPPTIRTIYFTISKVFRLHIGAFLTELRVLKVCTACYEVCKCK